jgi:hypothetical protein
MEKCDGIGTLVRAWHPSGDTQGSRACGVSIFNRPLPVAFWLPVAWRSSFAMPSLSKIVKKLIEGPDVVVPYKWHVFSLRPSDLWSVFPLWVFPLRRSDDCWNGRFFHYGFFHSVGLMRQLE